jgi:hypothetical protein
LKDLGARKAPFSFLNVDIYNIYIQKRKVIEGKPYAGKYKRMQHLDGRCLLFSAMR